MNELWQTISEVTGKKLTIVPSEVKAEIHKLSEHFTIERQSETCENSYLRKPKLLEAYLRYFLPLNAEKIFWILRMNPRTLNHTKSEQYWLDFGCGPGTATLAAMSALTLQKQCRGTKLRIDLVDKEPMVLELASKLITCLSIKLGLNVKLNLLPNLQQQAREQQINYDLALSSNILNELDSLRHGEREPLIEVWNQTIGTFLLVEPAHRVSSQRLVRFRERLLKHCADAKTPIHILAPCTHQKRCPVFRTKHWCHFSEELTNNDLIRLNMSVFNNPRLWLKFSYILAKREPESARNPDFFRAIGDLHQQGPAHLAIDLCQPDEKRVHVVSNRITEKDRRKLVRGRLVQG